MQRTRMRRARVLVVLVLALVLALVALTGCVDRRSGITGTQSIAVELIDPVDPGDLQHRLPAGAHAIEVNLAAYDAENRLDPSFDRDVQVYVQFLGTLTPTLGSRPLATIHMTAGQATGQTISLPPVFGPTTLWVDDGGDADPTYATGTSPTLWYRDPFIADIQTPLDEKALNALADSPLDNKQVSVSGSRYGEVGRLVVTSVFSQGYTVSDMKCSDASGAPPCAASAYDHIEVFSFSAPVDQNGRLLKQGQVIDGFTGGISEFNNLTEVGFPGTRTSSDDVVPGRLPAPVKLDPLTWFKGLPDPAGIINFERNEAAPIEIDNARVCALDSDYDRFKQWKIDPTAAADCAASHVINVVTSGVITDLDPATLVGKTVPRVVGVLRPVFNIWIINPRSADDLTLPVLP
ncbi:MAG TPA: hypothetical protein VFT22_12100 [Kofleriaceae bacterium]|nr:hypothetical protein [Kofleriaceae bacterium]